MEEGEILLDPWSVRTSLGTPSLVKIPISAVATDAAASRLSLHHHFKIQTKVSRTHAQDYLSKGGGALAPRSAPGWDATIITQQRACNSNSALYAMQIPMHCLPPAPPKYTHCFPIALFACLHQLPFMHLCLHTLLQMPTACLSDTGSAGGSNQH